MSDQPPSANRLEVYMPIDAELLPCPFCGGEAVLTNVRQSNNVFALARMATARKRTRFAAGIIAPLSPPPPRAR
jgi:hypothetical protein